MHYLSGVPVYARVMAEGILLRPTQCRNDITCWSLHGQQNARYPVLELQIGQSLQRLIKFVVHFIAAWVAVANMA